MTETRVCEMENPARWLKLPADIRNQILNKLVAHKKGTWGSLATVCREWQHMLERPNFRKLTIRPACIEELQRIVLSDPAKRSFIQHICLEVELPTYPTTCCPSTTTPARSDDRSNDNIVESALARVLDWLDTLDREGELTFELNVYSPSDAKHWFQNIYLSSEEVEAPAKAPTSRPAPGSIANHDLAHAWHVGRKWAQPPHSAIGELFKPLTLEDLAPRRVEAVTCLIIRRQLRRCISPRGTRCLLKCFPKLESFWYEPWEPAREWSQTEDIRADRDRRMYCAITGSQANASLTKE